jgi:hypothetical protein|tara:strand:+ start:4017 stop:4265 length:249 start_codon:yes stop_codon:yes gene_type:complete
MINDLIKKGQQWVLIVGLIGSIGGGFYSYGQLMLRIDNIEAKTNESVDLAPINEKIVLLEEKVNSLEKSVDKLGDNDNPLAQ